MATNKVFLAAALAFVMGAAASVLVNDADDAPLPPRPADISFDQSRPLEDRIAALERALSDERQARQLLQEEVLVLTEAMDRESGDPRRGPESVDTPSSVDEVQTRRRGRGRNGPADTAERVERFVAAGFTAAEADWIMRRESELRMEALNARYEAQRSGEPVDFLAGRGAVPSALRAELGDAGYERYLEANGRPTQVFVSSVIDGSPALSAGLQPGDQIVSYDGRRVFSMREITALTMQGQVGDSVLVNIQREGTLMQVAIPRGPLGITGGRRTR